MKELSNHELQTIKSLIENFQKNSPDSELNATLNPMKEKIDTLLISPSRKIVTLLTSIFSRSNDVATKQVTDNVEVVTTEIETSQIPVSIKTMPLGGTIEIGAEGYSDYNSADDTGAPIEINNDGGELSVSLWTDINNEDPTHVVSLSGARNECRKPA